MTPGASWPRISSRSFSTGERRRQDEHVHRVRDQPANLRGALPVDLQHDVLARGNLPGEPGARRRIPVAVHLCVFEELALVCLRAMNAGSSTKW